MLTKKNGIPSDLFSFEDNGYQVLSSGLIIQWGRFEVAANSIQSFNLPIPFPNAHLCAVGNIDAGFTSGFTVGCCPNGLDKVMIQNGDTMVFHGIRFIAIGY